MGRNDSHLYTVIGIAILSLGALLWYKPPGPYLMEPLAERREFHFHNGGHYGDNILNLKFLYNISEGLKQENILIYYHYPGHCSKIEELEAYVDKGVVKLESGPPPPEAIELWFKNEIDGVTGFSDMSKYYDLFYKKILRILGMEGRGIDTSLFQKEEYLIKIYEQLDPKYKDIDVLIINAVPQSYQFNYNKEQFDETARQLSKKFRVVTTSPVDSSIPCTIDDGLKMQDIGAVSTHAKYILAVFSGPLIPCFNLHTKEHVKKWLILQSYSPTFEGIDYRIVSALPEAEQIISEFSVG